MRASKTFHFDAAHKLPGHPTCGCLHGHTWTLTVGVSGIPDPTTGMVMDFKELTRIVKTYVLDELDHKYLNDLFFYRNQLVNPTCEYMVDLIGNVLLEQMPPEVKALHITLKEGMGGEVYHVFPS